MPKTNSSDQTVSIVIVNYNAGEWLAPCVSAAVDAADEVVVVDNASTDQSLHSLASFESRITIVKRLNNDGLSKAVNEGARLCTGRYLLLLNPDCLLQADTLNGLLADFKAHPEAGIVGPLIFNADGSEQRGGRRHEPSPWRALMRSLPLARLRQRAGFDMHEHPLPEHSERVDAISGSCLLIERGLFDQLGGMDDAFFLHFEDLDLCTRARRQSRSVRFVPGVFALHAQGVSSARRPYWIEIEKHRSMYRYYTKHYLPDHVLMRIAAYVGIAAAVSIRFILIAVRLALRRALPARSVAGTAHRLQMLTGMPTTHPHADNDPTPRPGVLIVGAASLVGRQTMAQATRAGYPVIGFTRKQHVPAELVHIDWLSKGPVSLFKNVQFAIHLAPIWTLADYIDRYADLGVTHLIGLSSSSIDTKASSADDKDRRLAKRLVDAETQVRAVCDQHNIQVTLFRPTMIFDANTDSNIGFIRRVIKRWYVFPLIGEGSGLRQPVYAGDVAKACWQRLDQHASWQQTILHLPGGEVLSYRSMVEQLFKAMHRKPRFIPVPEGLLAQLLKGFSLIPGCGFLSSGMARRMSEDLCFPAQPAHSAFGYQPQKYSDLIDRLVKESSASTHD